MLLRKFAVDFLTMQVPVDGPTARLRTLSQSAVLGELIYKLINGDFNEDEWLHMLWEAWRNHLWNRVSRERSHHYAGAHEVDRIRTMKWYNQLQQVADNTIADTDDMEISQARAQLGVLRTIFAGGLLTPDRALRHRNKGGHHLCCCGLERESVEHVSWRCMQYQNQRNVLFQKLSCTLEDLPVCVQYAAIIPMGSNLSDGDIFNIQSFLVNVWRHHIQQWHAGEDLTVIPQNLNSHQVLRGEDVEKMVISCLQGSMAPVYGVKGVGNSQVC